MVCVECGVVEHVPVEGDWWQVKIDIKRLLLEQEWLLSLVDPQNEVLAPVCKMCASKVYPPELLEAARRQLLDE
jgi:hypothetical protein